MKYGGLRPIGPSKRIKLDSNEFFNDPKAVSELQSMGMDVDPVDVYGGFVPVGKSLTNLKKNEQLIRDRFSLNAGGDE